MHFGAAPLACAGHLAAAPSATPSRNSIWCTLPSRQMVRRSQSGQRVHHRHADAVQAAGDLVGVGVELAAGVQLGHDDLGGRALELVVVLDAGRDAAAVVQHRDRVVGMDGDHDLVAEAGQRLVDRVVDDLEHHVMQAGAVGGVADVHPGALAHRLEALQDLDRVASRSRWRRAAAARFLRVLPPLDPHRHDDVLEIRLRRHSCISALDDASPNAHSTSRARHVVQHVEQVVDVEADVERIACVLHLELLLRLLLLGVGGDDLAGCPRPAPSARRGTSRWRGSPRAAAPGAEPRGRSEGGSCAASESPACSPGTCRRRAWRPARRCRT